MHEQLCSYHMRSQKRPTAAALTSASNERSLVSHSPSRPRGRHEATRNLPSAVIQSAQARLDVAHTKQAESEGGRQQALKAVQEAWKQIDDLRADVRCGAVPLLIRAMPSRTLVPPLGM